MNKRETGIAVLIDGENVGASFAGKILGALRSLGRIDIGNVYFDLQRGQSVEWIRDLPSLPLEPVVTAVEETGKSGSDISLILDAVEILHTRDIGIFCICSSDGDFTGLARYLKAHGKSVIAAGDGMRTPSSLRVSCDRFIDIGKPESAMISELKSPDPAAPDGRAGDQPCANDGADARLRLTPGRTGPRTLKRALRGLRHLKLTGAAVMRAEPGTAVSRNPRIRRKPVTGAAPCSLSFHSAGRMRPRGIQSLQSRPGFRRKQQLARSSLRLSRTGRQLPCGKSWMAVRAMA